jgi:hypothetical protein
MQDKYRTTEWRRRRLSDLAAWEAASLGSPELGGAEASSPDKAGKDAGNLGPGLTRWADPRTAKVQVT